jgi:hypothetical protein
MHTACRDLFVQRSHVERAISFMSSTTGRSMLAAMTAVFEGSPFPLAWEPGS